MASVVWAGIYTVYKLWYSQQPDGQLDTHQLSGLDTTYVVSLVRAAERALKELPTAAATPDHGPQGKRSPPIR